MMQEIHLTRGQVTQVDDADFAWLNQWLWQATYHKTRKVFTVTRQLYTPHHNIGLIMSRVILDAPPGVLVDHKDRNPLNNQRSNLRYCSTSQNAMNQRRVGPQKSSRYKGVAWITDHHKWRAQIMLNGRHRFLGYFTCEEDAAYAYDEAARALYHEFAYVNFPLVEELYP